LPWHWLLRRRSDRPERLALYNIDGRLQFGFAYDQTVEECVEAIRQHFQGPLIAERCWAAADQAGWQAQSRPIDRAFRVTPAWSPSTGGWVALFTLHIPDPPGLDFKIVT
jgi:hypothetical protein